jgi:hypothetical protein
MNILEYVRNRLSTIGIGSEIGPIFVEYEFCPNGDIYFADMSHEALLFLVKHETTKDELSQFSSWQKNEDPIEKLGAGQIVIVEHGKYVIDPNKKIVHVYKLGEPEVESGKIVIPIIDIDPRKEWEKFIERRIDAHRKLAR